MTVLAVSLHAARARAARIRSGMVGYLTTLADVAAAYAERDWEALGYSSWDAYVDGEYSEQRLKLSPEHRQKAVAELRLAGMSTRAIGSALGVGKSTVDRDLSTVPDGTVEPERIISLDGRERPAVMPERPRPEPAPVEMPAGQAFADAFTAEVDRQMAKATGRRAAIQEHNARVADLRKDITPEREAEIVESVRHVVEFKRLVDTCSEFLDRLALVDFTYAARGVGHADDEPIRVVVDRAANLANLLGDNDE